MNPDCNHDLAVSAAIEYFVLMLAFTNIIVLLPAVLEIVGSREAIDHHTHMLHLRETLKMQGDMHSSGVLLAGP